jgi:hypothetical protein
MSIANIVDTLRTGGAVDFSAVDKLASDPVSEPPAINNWQMNFNQNTLSESCEVSSKKPLLGVGLLAYSADGATFYFGTYCSMTNATDQAADYVAYPTASTSLFNPDVNGHDVMAIVYGEVQGSDGKMTPFSLQKNFSV